VLAVGGFLAGGLIYVQALGPLLNPFPEWLVISILVGIGRGRHGLRNPTAGSPSGALVRSGLMTSML
jgi:hypothetical protein